MRGKSIAQILNQYTRLFRVAQEANNDNRQRLLTDIAMNYGDNITETLEYRNDFRAINRARTPQEREAAMRRLANRLYRRNQYARRRS